MIFQTGNMICKKTYLLVLEFKLFVFLCNLILERHDLGFQSLCCRLLFEYIMTWGRLYHAIKDPVRYGKYTLKGKSRYKGNGR